MHPDFSYNLPLHKSFRLLWSSAFNTASLGCRRLTRATRCVTPVVLYTNVDARDQYVINRRWSSVELSWQHLRRSMCRGDIFKTRVWDKVTFSYTNNPGEIPPELYSSSISCYPAKRLKKKKNRFREEILELYQFAVAYYFNICP